MFKFGPCIFGGELPVDVGLLPIACVLPGFGFLRQCLFVGNSTSQALSRQDIQFDFGHVEPATMFQRVDDLDPIDDSASFLRREGFVQRAKAVRVEVIHHERDPPHGQTAQLRLLTNVLTFVLCSSVSLYEEN